MIRTIQPAQTSSVDAPFDPMLRQPYPFHIGEDGAVQRQDFWRGEPSHLIGFQRDRNVQHVDLTTAEWFQQGKDVAVGMWPVFTDAGGGMWNLVQPVASVTETA